MEPTDPDVPDVSCTVDTLVLHRRLPDLEPALRTALADWFREHGIDAADVAVGHPVVRDEVRRVLTWFEQVDEHDDDAVRRRWTYSGTTDAWPAEFGFDLRRAGRG